MAIYTLLQPAPPKTTNKDKDINDFIDEHRHNIPILERCAADSVDDLELLRDQAEHRYLRSKLRS